MSKERGKLIVFEGPDGVGKTTVSQALSAALQTRGVKTLWQSFPGKETGTLGSLIYQIHHQPESYCLNTLNAASRQLLHIAAHIDTIERVIRPALLDGTWVILDRFWWSTLVYGTVGGADPRSLMQMIGVEQVHWQGILPHIVILLERGEVSPNEIDTFAGLSNEYADLASAQSAVCHVERLRNDASLEDVLNNVLNLIGPSNG